VRGGLATPGHSSESRPGTLANACLSGRLASTRVHGCIDSLTSPKIRQSDDPSPKGRHFRAAHEALRSLARCRVPAAARRDLSLRDRARLSRLRTSAVRNACFDSRRATFPYPGMHDVDRIIVASRPSRVVVLARRILDERAIQSVSINDAPQMCVKFRIRVLRSWCWRRAAEVKKDGSLDDVHVEARHNKLRQTERRNCSPRVGSVCRHE
jgi:hypothetical protein